jgi:hypothetical protein
MFQRKDITIPNLKHKKSKILGGGDGGFFFQD